MRLIAFDKFHLVLGVDPLSSSLPEEEEGGGASVGTKRDAPASESADGSGSKKIKLASDASDASE